MQNSSWFKNHIFEIKINNMTKKNIKFTIIVPMYNVGNYISECLGSVLKQSYKFIEIIVIDDQSTDDSVIKCGLLLDLGSNFILLGQRHAGPNVARNLGISYASGDYVIFIDADDRLVANALEIILNELRQYPQSDVISFGYEFFNEDTGSIHKITRPSRNHLNSTDIFIESLRGRDFGGVCWNKCYKLSFLLNNKLQFYPDSVHGRDLIFTRAVAYYAEEWCSVDAVLYQSRLRSGSFSRNFTDRNIYSAVDVATKLLDIFLADSIRLHVLDDLYYSIYKHIRYMTILSAFRSNDFKEYKVYFGIIQDFAQRSFLQNYPSLKNLRMYDLLLHLLSRNPVVIWTVARILKIFNYQPY